MGAWAAWLRAWLPGTAWRLAALACIEYAFNVDPSTAASSLVLQVGHAAVLAALWCAPASEPRAAVDDEKED